MNFDTESAECMHRMCSACRYEDCACECHANEGKSIVFNVTYRRMKARDLVNGWPHGRSCSSPFYQGQGGYAEWWMKFRMRNPFDLAKLEEDLRQEHEYRDRQQRMVDRFRAGVKFPPFQPGEPLPKKLRIIYSNEKGELGERFY